MAETVSRPSVTVFVSVPSPTPQKLRSLYSQPIAALVANYTGDPNELLVRNMHALRCWEGIQVAVSWDPPIAHPMLDELRLVRKAYTHPTTVDDGVVVYVGAPSGTVFVDTSPELVPGIPYYYTMFSRLVTTGEWVYGVTTMLEATTPPARYFGDLLWRKLPRLYRMEDSRLAATEGTGLALEETEVPGGGLVHIGENGSVVRGQLERFLRILGLELDYTKSLIDALQYVGSAETCPANFLKHLAALIGWELNMELAVGRQRQEILNTVALYKRKGTVSALETLGRTILGVSVEPWSYVRSILVSNRTDRLSADLTDPAEVAKYGLPGCLVGHSVDWKPGAIHWFDKIALFFYMDLDDTLGELQVRKLGRYLPKVTPADTVILPVFVDDPPVLDGYDHEDIQEFADFGEDGTEVEPIRSNPRVMKSNSAIHLSNAMLSQAVWNHIARESWYDEIVHA